MFADATELTGNPAAQLTLLLERLRELVGAAVTGELTIQLGGDGGAAVVESVDRGWANESDRARLYAFYGSAGLGANPFAASVMARGAQQPGGELAVRREDIVDDRAWYRSEFYAEVSRPVRLDHSIYSMRPGLRPGVVHGLGLSRPAGDAPFDEDERALVQLFHRELLPLVRRLTPTQLDERRATLTPREEDVMERLLDGKTDKEIAADLRLSRYTVSQHVRAILRKLDVAGRGELLAMHLPRRSRR